MAALPHPPTAPAREAFAWREALSPAVSPAGSARGSHGGSHGGSCAGSRRGSDDSTPRSATPPMSPFCGGGNSARSSRSNHSARSRGASPGPGAAGYPGVGAPLGYDAYSARSSISNYATPDPSARSSEFTSVYDAASVSPSARVVADPAAAPDRRRAHKAYAAAFDAFATLGEGEGAAASSTGPAPVRPPPAPVAASLDPRQVFSAARHGKHKEVEASLQEGFDPQYADSFGNTLFHVACQNGNKRIAKLAIKYGGDMDRQNGRGNTGLHFLFAYGYPDVGEYFIEKGASEHVPNELGKGAREGIR